MATQPSAIETCLITVSIGRETTQVEMKILLFYLVEMNKVGKLDVVGCTLLVVEKVIIIDAG